MQIDKQQAERVLLEEADRAQREPGSNEWERLVERLSEACEGSSKTHIAFLGTALLAKATNPAADAYAVKAGASTDGAYSARSLGHGVLVPRAPELGIDLGVSGREPLNNQPYFRIMRATPDEILPLVKGSSRAPVEVLCKILAKLDALNDRRTLRAALRAFIRVRRRYQPEYPTAPSARVLSVDMLINMASTLVAADSEGGRRAQAVAAGILDLFGGPARVETTRVNDPDRHIPGDVGVRSIFEAEDWERLLEVRDKPVSEHDLILFARKAAQAGVTKAAVLAVASTQPRIETAGAYKWAMSNGVSLTIFWDWASFIEAAVFWSPLPHHQAVAEADAAIRSRLVQLEASPEAVQAWDSHAR